MSGYYYKSYYSSKESLIDFATWSITLREFIFSIFIFGVCTFIGFLIHTKIENKVNRANLIYRQAVVLNTEDEFKHAMETDFGYAFMYGEYEALNPVKYSHISGEYSYIHAIHEQYNIHTETYTETDEKGRIQVKTRTYWSWDYAGDDEFHTKMVKYCGVDFPYHKFGYMLISDLPSIVSTGFHERDVIYTRPVKFNGSIFGEMKHNTITGRVDITKMTPVNYREYLIKTHSSFVFWFGWIILTCVVIWVFYYIENDWLED